MTLDAVAQSMDMSIMTALHAWFGMASSRAPAFQGAPWVIKAEDLAAYREQKPRGAR